MSDTAYNNSSSNSSTWLSVEQARAAIMAQIKAIDGTVDIAIEKAVMRIIANDIISPLDVPGHDNSAMDGFACLAKDVVSDKPITLRCMGESFAGRAFDGAPLVSGQCIKIMTGAIVPMGADMVIAKEQTTNHTDTVIINPDSHYRAGLNIRYRGEDLKANGIALSSGHLCSPASIGLLASLGLSTVTVKRPLKVAFFSTGDEIRTLGESLKAGEIYDSNRHILRAMIERLGFCAIDYGVVKDNPKKLQEVLKQAQTADAIITSGGASVGEADYIRQVLAQCGQVLFWKVAMRPGRPLAYGKVGDADFFGLPGNPVSVMVCFYQFVRAALWRRAGRLGLLDLPMVEAIATTAIRKAAGRTEFQRGYLHQNHQKQWQVTPTGDQGSGILSSMTRANSFIVLSESTRAVVAGDRVMVQPFEGTV